MVPMVSALDRFHCISKKPYPDRTHHAPKGQSWGFSSRRCFTQPTLTPWKVVLAFSPSIFLLPVLTNCGFLHRVYKRKALEGLLEVRLYTAHSCSSNYNKCNKWSNYSGRTLQYAKFKFTHECKKTFFIQLNFFPVFPSWIYSSLSGGGRSDSSTYVNKGSLTYISPAKKI